MSRTPELSGLTEPQLEVMQVVWQHEEITVTGVWQAISAKRSIARNTVLTVLDRLEKRGWLQKRSVGNVQLYRAAVSEQATLMQAVQRLINSFFGGSSEALAMTLLQEGDLSPQVAQRIRGLIEKASKKSR